MALGQIIALKDAPKGARIISCGGRMFARPYDFYPSKAECKADEIRIAFERALLFQTLDKLKPKEIAEGEAPGADSVSREWAVLRGVPCSKFPALWGVYSFGAGPERNRRMFRLFKPDGVVAFPGGSGTRDMSEVALKGGAWLVRIEAI
jgi:hypothetical protein